MRVYGTPSTGPQGVAKSEQTGPTLHSLLPTGNSKSMPVFGLPENLLASRIQPHLAPPAVMVMVQVIFCIQRNQISLSKRASNGYTHTT